jgi:hypothetical protein
MTDELTWGASVTLKRDKPSASATARLGEVVALWRIETAAVSAKYGEPLDTAMCTVELPDGSSTEVPARYLAKVTS